jgi:PIN domain nuclease of toxin-antitoxin system
MLSRQQAQAVEAAVSRTQTVGLCAMSLLEIAVLSSQGRLKLKTSLDLLFEDLRTNSVFQILPITYEIATEVASMGTTLKDPADRAIVATARVHRLRLVTSDQRIIESKLVSVID